MSRCLDCLCNCRYSSAVGVRSVVKPGWTTFFLGGLPLDEGIEWCGDITALWCLSVPRGSLVQIEQIYLKLLLGMNSQELTHGCTASILCVAVVRQGRGTLEACCWDWVPEGVDSWSGAHSHSANVCVILKQNLQCTNLALHEKARFHKVVSIWAQVTCGLVATVCLNLQS